MTTAGQKDFPLLPDEPRLLAIDFRITRLGPLPSITSERYFAHDPSPRFALSQLSWDKLVARCPVSRPTVFGKDDLLVWIGGRTFNPSWVMGQRAKAGESPEASAKLAINLQSRALEWLFEQDSLLVEYLTDNVWRPASGWRIVELSRDGGDTLSAGGERPAANDAKGKARKRRGGRRLLELDDGQRELAEKARHELAIGTPWKEITKLCGGLHPQTLRKYIRMLEREESATGK